MVWVDGQNHLPTDHVPRLLPPEPVMPHLMSSACSTLAAVRYRWGGLLLPVVTLAILCAVSTSVSAEPSGIRIVSLVQLEAAPAAVPEDDAGLLALAKGQGRSLPNMDAASYVPFAPQWLVLRLSRSEAVGQGLSFRITSTQRREIDAFLIVDGRLVAKSAGGYARVSIWDSLEKHDFKLPLDAWTGPEATILLRHVTAERIPFLPGFPDAAAIRRAAVLHNSFLFFFIGCALIFTAIHFVMFLGLRERSSLDFALFVGAAVVVQSARYGFLSRASWPGETAAPIVDWFHLMRLATVLIGIRMIESFADLKEWNMPRLQAVNRRLPAIVIVGTVVAALLGTTYLQSAIVLWSLLLVPWGLTVAILAANARRPGSVLVLVGWSGLGSAIVYTNLVIAGFLPSGLFLPFVTPTGVLWAISFSSAGLFRKMNVLRDQQVQSQLRQVEVQGLGRLIQVVCHDINNPLCVIRLTTELMRRQIEAGATPHALAPHMQRIKGAEHSITEIIEDVRSLEVLRNSNGNLPVSAGNVGALAREALSMFPEKAAAKDVRFEDHLPAVPVIALVAPGILVRNVLANLLSNAVKFAPHGSAITLSVALQPGRVGLRVTDRGAGIPPDTVAALERAEPLTSQLGTAGERGTGFGLRITRDFLAAMGGSLEFQPPENGSGTVATAWLRRS